MEPAEGFSHTLKCSSVRDYKGSNWFKDKCQNFLTLHFVWKTIKVQEMGRDRKCFEVVIRLMMQQLESCNLKLI